MDTHERIVEAYLRHVKGWTTIPNIRCKGQREIDLLAIDPIQLSRYHIEVSISLDASFKKLKAMQEVNRSGRPEPDMVAYYVERKFTLTEVVEKLEEYGFIGDSYRKVVVYWDWTAEAEAEATQHGIELWSFQDILHSVVDRFRDESANITDDTIRTLQVYARALDEMG